MIQKALKLISCRGSGCIIQIAYIIHEGMCVFTYSDTLEGHKPGVSTVNLAETIIMDICEYEGIYMSDITFYDLQTSHRYTRHGPGEFEFEELEYSKEYGMSWRPTPCPVWVLQLFKHFIHAEPEQAVQIGLERASL